MELFDASGKSIGHTGIKNLKKCFGAVWSADLRGGKGGFRLNTDEHYLRLYAESKVIIDYHLDVVVEATEAVRPMEESHAET